MILKFYISYNTQWGEELYISGSTAELGNNEIDAALKLEYDAKGRWYGEINCNPLERDRIISYKYFIKHKKNNGSDYILYESGADRKLALNSDTVQIVCFDEWQKNDARTPFLTAPFSKVLFGAKSNPYTQIHTYNKEFILKATVPNIPQNCSVQVCGNLPALGEWDIKKAPTMTREEGCKWSLAIPADNLPEKLEYKFVYNSIIWENGENRQFNIPQIPKNSSIIKEHASIIFPDEFSLGYNTHPKYAGCAIPVFSLRTKNSHGIGDFSDIKLFIDFMSKTGMKILQLLPINDTIINMNWHDSYPYNCVSSFALHPIYINLLDTISQSEGKTIEELTKEETNSNINDNNGSGVFGGLLSGKKKKIKTNTENNSLAALIKSIKHEGKLLNIKSVLDYEDVIESKFRFLKQIYTIENENTFAQPEFYSFVKSNKFWLKPYAEFSAMRDKYKTADFHTWGKEKVTKEETDFYIFIQYHLYLQMNSAKKYAHKNGIVLKGDIPIGVAPHSVEVWQNPELFHTDESAGAPPDAFCKDGQNWGFPTYNWEAMEKNHFSWWRNRFSQMSKYFDAYRLDHILGFFRIWEIPTYYKSALMGHFYPAQTYTRAEIASLMGLSNESECRNDWFIDNCTDGALAGTFGEASDSVLIKSVSKNANEYETLFIEDPYKHRYYHPMIGGLESYTFFSLLPNMKEAYKNLYNDFFYRRNNKLWYDNAMNKLQQLIASSNLLSCGEDLGMRNMAVTDCMRNLHILSLELQIMPKEGDGLGKPASYPYLSVCTTSTHDCETLRMWLGKMLHGNNSDATPVECEKVINENLAAQSMFTILPLQDWLSLSVKHRTSNPGSERINDPSNPNQYWQYRMPVLTEDLIEDSDLCSKILCLIEKSGRIIK